MAVSHRRAPALAFALAHAPRWLALAPGNLAVTAAVITANAVAGLVFGHLFLRSGIETAMGGHLGPTLWCAFSRGHCSRAEKARQGRALACRSR